MAIALFYSIATAIGGISGPVLFGNIIGTGNAASLFVAYLVGAGFMIFAAVVELIPFRFVDVIMKTWQRYSTHR
jgi:zinc transporter ZupT